MAISKETCIRSDLRANRRTRALDPCLDRKILKLEICWAAYPDSISVSIKAKRLTNPPCRVRCIAREFSVVDAKMIKSVGLRSPPTQQTRRLTNTRLPIGRKQYRQAA